MTLRLVLVSLVAAMGLTVPSAPVIESWVASTQNWMNARFADWDTRSPQTADYVIVSNYYDVGRFAPRPAISSPEGIGPVSPELIRKPAAPVRFDPMPVVREVYREVQLELAEWSRTLVSVLPGVIFPASSPRRIETIVVPKNRCGPVADQWTLLGQGIGINPAIAGSPRPAVGGPTRQAMASQTSFGPMETSASIYFAGELTLPAKSVIPTGPMEPKQPSPTPFAVSPPLSSSATETCELPDDSDIELAGELVRQDDGFAAHAPARIAPVIATTPCFDPLEIQGDYYVGTAFELNMLNDGLNIPGEPVVQTTKTNPPAPESGREISRAVRLTREAVYAWVNIFTGPALVTVSRSN